MQHLGRCVVAFGEKGFWLGPDEIAVASGAPVADWTEGRIEATVTDRTKDLATPVEFTVTPGDGTAEKAFLRIRK